jgi:hypothetical protein
MQENLFDALYFPTNTAVMLLGNRTAASELGGTDGTSRKIKKEPALSTLWFHF